MDESKRELHKKIIASLLINISVILVLLFVVPKLLRFFLPVIVAWVIAWIANPMVQFLEKRIKLMRKHGSAVVIIFVLAVVAVIVYLLLYLIVQQGISFSKDFPAIYDDIINGINRTLESIHQKVDFIPKDIHNLIGKRGVKIRDAALAFVNSFGNKSTLSTVGNFASSLIDGTVLVILTLMLAYFFVAERAMINEKFKKYIPEIVKDFWDVAKENCFLAIGAYLKACFIIMIIVFFMLWFIFAVLLNAEYAILLALITAFLDFLPFLGTGITLTPWGIYCLATGDYKSVIIIVIAYFLSLLAHRILEPKLIGDRVGMSPLATLISMFIGYRLIGVLGLIVGIPAGMILVAFQQQGMFDDMIRGMKILVKDINEWRKF